MATKIKSKASAALALHSEPKHPHAVSILETPDEGPDQPLVEGARDEVDPDLRHRMISEAAYYRYVERGYFDGYELDDWLQSQADLDRVLLNRTPRVEDATAD
jgi:hypothetical protein